MAEGWAPQLRKVEITPENPPVDFQLGPGKTIRIRFVERSGEPIPKVEVAIDGWRGVKSLYNNKHSNVLDTKIPRYADNRGVFEWTWAPEDAVIYAFCRPGHRGMSPQGTLTADGVEHEFVLGRARPYFFVP